MMCASDTREGATGLCRPALTLALIAGALARILLITAVFDWSEAPTRSDDLTYRQIAESLLEDGRLATHHFPVGYPLFLGVILAATGGSYIAVRVVQVLLGVLTIAVASRIARLLYGEEAGAITAWLMALYPPLLYLTGRIMSETLFIALLMSSILFFLNSDRDRASSLLGPAAFLFGLACLVRSNLVLMIPAIPGWLLLRPGGALAKKLLNAGLVTGTLGAVLISPGLYFWATQGEFVPFATNAGQTFYGANNPLADGGWVQVEDHPELLREISPDVRRSNTTYSRAQYRLGFGWIQRNPRDFLRLLPKKLANAWIPGFQRAEFTSSSRVAFIVQACSLGFVLVGAIAGRLLVRPRQRDCLLLAVLGTYTVMSLVFYGNPRIGLFCAPILIVYAAALIGHLARRRASSRTTSSVS